MERILETKMDYIQKTNIETVEKERNENKFLGSQKKIPGLTLFSFNKKTSEIKKAEIIREIQVDMNGDPIYVNRLQIEPDCFYGQALNKKNFIKKLVKRYKSVQDQKQA